MCKMDLEAIQILNLSPIPELSEIELSTMLEHLSGLSDINGDLTDRNVEDILKEAEDLLDRSTCSQTHESKSVNKSSGPEEKPVEINENTSVSESKEQNLQLSDLEESKQQTQQTTSVSSNSQINSLDEREPKKNCNSSAENTSAIYSPGSSSNPIKSTIDSLKEFSTMIEKKLNKQSPNSSPKAVITTKKNQIECQVKEVSNSPVNKISVTTKQAHNNVKTVKTPDLNTRKNVTEPIDKSVKLLNCFERLYRDKPVRLNSKKPKVVDKAPKAIIKKKLPKELRSSKKSNLQSKTSGKKIMEDDIEVKTYQKANQYFSDEEEMSKPKQVISSYYILNDDEYLLEKEDEVDIPQKNKSSDNFQCDDIKSQMDEKLMLKVLEGMEETKVQIKRTSAVSDGENSEKNSKIDKNITRKPKPEVRLEKNLFETGINRNSEINRLEEQFFSLKEKYNHQIDKLEAENFKLREALIRQQETFLPQEFLRTDNGAIIINSSYSWAPENKLSRTFSLENCKAPKNSPCSSSEDIQTSTTVREACSQTEKNLKNTSIQCSQDSRDVGTNSEFISEAKKTENKENLLAKKKLAKFKPFSDVNVYHTIRQRKVPEHETQLLATLRGLQAEVTVKDKENRKLKSEIESLKRQMKKQPNVRMDNIRRYNIGTQTIGLSAFLQKPYNPENYQVPFEFERENEDLRSRIKALEEDFEFLKEKRISDLQALHQVHEEEMAKLVSKLETQSALTKHLHSLLVNR